MADLMVTGEELARYAAEIDKVLVGVHGKGHSREVRFHVHYQSFDVYDHGKLILSTQVADEAAQAFNAIRPQS